ncbi:MAG: Chromosome segregation and condensation protein ScpA [Parcubacteria group bacterium GW2011_GWB1_50_9]|uniref:Segregation and condensation protein A n=1 Tax=Candidatus Adlerbacteria bacterium GW2011_GWC1_50_9 TaxID=1618608 RepID=A0A0G1WPV6_9BACT|nr:MAG: Chromosome segregation and condensation protein ScpA [Parcubacteria group bacterium GW2011_GWB1_50_9]KKW20590.1 MAG: chromosome segregation and condensation protein ScpA, segregation and condensation protein A [Candidatus Adlerbacteria bacterium GW2011_GWC1_50_9]
MTAYVFKHEKFEGPLQILLELIEKEKLAISEISLAKVADEYLLHVKSLGAINPDELAEFLVIAAQLMLLKSRSLLPHLELDEEEKSSIEELERRLEEYRRARERASALKERAALGLRIHARESFFGLPPVFFPPPGVGLGSLKAAFEAFVEALPKLEKLVEERIKKVISLEEKISHIRSFLMNVVERAFSEIIKGSRERTEVIVSFLAILELARQRFVDLDQSKPFGDIVIKRL